MSILTNIDTDIFCCELDNKGNISKKNKIIRNYDPKTRRLNGIYEEFDSDGRLIKKCNFLNNKLDGPCIIKIFNGDNLIQVTKLFYTDGELNGPYEVKKYKSNNLTTLIKSMYQSDKLNGLYEEKEYNNLGSLILVINKEYVNNVLNGPFIEMNINFTREGTYINGLLNGLIITVMRQSNLLKYSLFYRDNKFEKVIDAQDIHGRDMLLSEGNIIVWKAGKTDGHVKVIVKLEIPIEVNRTILIPETDYHRVAKANVLEIKDSSGNSYSTCVSLLNTDTPLTYTVGGVVNEFDFDDNIFNKTGKGIYCYKYKDLVNQWL